MTFGGIIAALGASVCCSWPLLFLALGILGAWIGNFTALEPYKSYFIGVAVIFLSIGFLKFIVNQKPSRMQRTVSALIRVRIALTK